MLYPQTFIEELKQRADIMRVVEGYVPLKKKGQNWWAPCPFHQEKTASFSVNPGKGMYKCFGCGKGGNVFTFVMELEGLSFPEAVKVVAEKAGVPLPDPVDGRDYEQTKKAADERKRIAAEVVQLNEWAVEFWQNHLQDKKAKAARKYLEERGMLEETVAAFKLGYAPESWDALKSYLKEKGAGDKQIEISGLVGVNEEKERVYDRFRGRIMFPVLDVDGKPIAFGARAMGKDEPKYLNSPETPAYTKGNHLYGLFQAREEIRKKKFAILVEGYFDLITPFQNEVKNVVASSGTAFTEAQAKLLGRFARKVVVNYDGDSAGVKAARRAIETLLAEDFEIKVLVLPEGSDPDEFINSNGVEAYNKHRGQAAPHLQFVLEQAVRDKNLSVPKQKAAAIEEVMPVICAVRNKTEKRESFDQAMSLLKIDAHTDKPFLDDLWESVKAGSSLDLPKIRRKVTRFFGGKVTIAEQQLLEMLVHDEELRKHVLPMLEETDYEALALASIFQALIEADKRSLEMTAENLSALLDEDDTAAHDLLPLLIMSNAPRGDGESLEEIQAEAENRVFTLRLMAIQEHTLQMHREQIHAEETGDTETLENLANKQVEMMRMKQKLEGMIRQD
ncbi:MAG TPA: DNA primase [Pyrinomonadaceae bacterium]|jgi:DNA primase|nr:DNA primase [Pyrinomonadaceae bacterium]